MKAQWEWVQEFRCHNAEYTTTHWGKLYFHQLFIILCMIGASLVGGKVGLTLGAMSHKNPPEGPPLQRFQGLKHTGLCYSPVYAMHVCLQHWYILTLLFIVYSNAADKHICSIQNSLCVHNFMTSWKWEADHAVLVPLHKKFEQHLEDDWLI